MHAKAKSFRVGKVAAVLRGRVWYLCYVEGGRRRRPRVGPDRDLARQMAAQINGQLEVGAPAALSYEPISVPDLRQQWLDHHEHVRRSSVATIKRYRAATEHRRRLRTNNALERLNREIKRRTRVATLFPNEASLLRLATAVLMETDEEWQTEKRYLPKKNQ